MAVSYKKLWKILIDKDMKKKDLAKLADVSTYTITKMSKGENSTDFGLLMAGAALASVPIIIVFLIFQKYFTKGITMGSVKG